jgi:hypothetical protein
MGIEPTSEAWEASILPLYDARSVLEFVDYTQLGDRRYRPVISHILDLGLNPKTGIGGVKYLPAESRAHDKDGTSQRIARDVQRCCK